VYQVGEPEAANLNDLIDPELGAYLLDAFDINDAGQIVGVALAGDPGAKELRPYIATPIRFPLPNFSKAAILVGILFGLTQDGSGTTTRGPVDPHWGERVWASLPPEQREALVSFAITNLADLISDREARSQIQRIAGEAASRALRQKRPLQPPTLSSVQQEQLAKAEKRVLPR
jgi:hypothetical protein